MAVEMARGGSSAGLARDVLERSRRRAAGAAPAAPRSHPRARTDGDVNDEDRERLSAAFASLVKVMRGVSKECENYYGSTAVQKCKEHEIRHFCKYHGKKVERKMDSTGEERSEGSRAPSQAHTCQQCPRRPSKDFYIEVSPGIYSVTAMSEDMVEQTHIVDVIAGQSIDLTFVL